MLIANRVGRYVKECVPEVELNERRTKWQHPHKDKPAGYLGKYAAMATSASTGAILKG